MRPRPRAAALGLAVAGAVSCAYYNGMWSADHLAKEARRLEASGRNVDARSYWSRAAVKAESMVVGHPNSRWAEDALVLQGEALARSGACARAQGTLALALRSVRDGALRERAALAAGECALEQNDPVGADGALATVVQSRDGRRRSRGAWLAGRAAAARGDYVSAIDWSRRSEEPAAGALRARVLLAAGRAGEAIVLLDTLARGAVREGEWMSLLEDVSRAAGADAASGALDRLLARGRMPAGARGRLLLADADRLFAAGRTAAAAARYARVVQLVSDSVEGQRARVRRIRVLAAQADSLPDLTSARRQLERLTENGGAGAAADEAQALQSLLTRASGSVEAPGLVTFRVAELVRDSLSAPRVAAQLFLVFAAGRPGSIFAPKALVAAAALLPEERDSLLAVLDSSHAGSPYTLALRGDPSPGFVAAEDSLAQALGLEPPAAAALRVRRVAPPVPGPRGPGLDPPPAGPPAPGSP